MALLVDCNIHYRVLKFLYSRATMDWSFPDCLRGILLIYVCGTPTNMFAISSGVNSFLCFRTSPLPCLGLGHAYITTANSLSERKLSLRSFSRPKTYGHNLGKKLPSLMDVPTRQP